MIKIYVTSAFSKDNTGGNKAGVVIGYPDLTVQQKMAISKKLGYSETAFVTESECADYKLEYFTPTEEVPLCGHATIAAFVTLHHLGTLKSHDVTIETKAGVLQVHVEEDGLVMMQQNNPRYYDCLTKEEICDCLRDYKEYVNAPIQIISTGLKDIILPIETVSVLNSFRPDFSKITDLSRKKEVVGIHAFALQKDASEVDAVCRNFAPLYGIDEESATGTSSCALAGYLAKYICKKERYIFEQGYSMGLPSRIIVNAEYEKNEIAKIFAGGYGYVNCILRMSEISSYCI